jgi:hypothetical protein
MNGSSLVDPDTLSMSEVVEAMSPIRLGFMIITAGDLMSHPRCSRVRQLVSIPSHYLHVRTYTWILAARHSEACDVSEHGSRPSRFRNAYITLPEADCFSHIGQSSGGKMLSNNNGCLK